MFHIPLKILNPNLSLKFVFLLWLFLMRSQPWLLRNDGWLFVCLFVYSTFFLVLTLRPFCRPYIEPVSIISYSTDDLNSKRKIQHFYSKCLCLFVNKQIYTFWTYVRLKTKKLIVFYILPYRWCYCTAAWIRWFILCITIPSHR